MEKKKESIVINVGDAAKEVILRHGKAPDIEPVYGVHVEGKIGSVLEFITKRNPDPTTTHVEVKRASGIITLYTNEGAEPVSQDIVEDRIKVNERFRQFGINENKVWDVNDLGKLFKRRRKFFPNASENAKLVAQLLNFRGRLDKQMEKIKDTSARHFKQAVEAVVESDLAHSFTLKMPIYDGLPEVEFTVEIILEPRDNNIVVYLESLEVEELGESVMDEAVEEQLKAIRDKYTVFEL